MTPNILLPIAGYAKRFIDKGFKLPKPLLPVNGTPMIKLAVNSLLPNSGNYKLIFVIREDHVINHDIINALQNIFKEYKTEFAFDYKPQGTLSSCLEAHNKLDHDEPLIIYTPDICYDGKFDIHNDFIETNYDGLLVTFKANSPDHSYVATKDGVVIETAEKKVISNDAAIGVYCFRTGKMFIDYAKKAIDINLKTNNEFYLAPIYNLLIADKLSIGSHRIDKMYVLGTPEDVEFYETYIAKYKTIANVAICCDHSGYILKEEICKILQELNINYMDFGAYSSGDSDHYDFLKPCSDYMKAHPGTIGIATCNTGQGFNIAANKIKGIRSSLINDSYTAEMSRRHNASNFFCLPSRTIQLDMLTDILKAILNNTFDGGRHTTRIQKFIRDKDVFIE